MSVLRRLAPWRGGGRAASAPSTAAARGVAGTRERVDAALNTIKASAAQGRLADALAQTRDALVDAPGDPELTATRGSILFEWGRYREAAADLAAAVQAGADRPALQIQLGWALLWSGNVDAAERSLRRAADVDPGSWQAHFGLGSALRARHDVDAALAAYAEALALSPQNADVLAEMVGCHVDVRRFDEALATAGHLRELHPDDASALATYAAVLIWHDRFADANAIYQRIASMPAVRADPARMPLDAGFALREGGRVADALAFYEQHLPSRPDPNAYTHYAFTLLKAGRVREGFARYEFRWMIEPLIAQRPGFDKPQWRGQPLAGKTLLVLGEQGFGDVIQFLRYLPLVKARGARIVLLLRKPMGELIDAGMGVDQVVQAGDALPRFDYHVPLLGLAHVLGTDLDTIPRNVPYVVAQDERIAHWRARIPSGAALNVGLVWAGDPLGGRGRQKSLALATLSPWGHIPGVRFFSLQKGDAAADAARPPAGLPLTDFSPDIRDFADTAAIIASLDLVISVCTSVTHLAGAMGARAWTMLPEPADWRWMEDRDDTPWYPTMRLFRQPRSGDWSAVVARVGDALAALVRERTTGVEAPAMDVVADDATRRDPADASPAPPPIAGLCAVAEARHGLFQYRLDGAPSERSVAHYGEDLEAQLDVLRDRIAAGATVLEVGSGIGAHTVPLGAHIGAQGHLLVSEPRTEFVPLLHQNLRANGIGGVTTLRTSLLGAAAGDPARDANATIDRLGLGRLDWLKINEGMDADAILAGAGDTLWAHRPGVFAAVADADGVARVAGRLRDFGYHCWRVDTPRFRPGNFNRRDDDIFAGAVVHAVLAVPEESTAVPPAGLQALD